MPSASLIKLIKYIQSERDRGYDNRTIIGGLDKIVNSWAFDAKREHMPEDQIAQIVDIFSAYPDLSIIDRKSGLDTLWNKLKLSDYSFQALHQSRKQYISPVQDLQHHAHEKIDNPEQSTTAKLSKSPVLNQPAGIISQEDTRFGLDAPLTVLPGIGPAKAKSLSLLGITTLGDLLYYFPRRYDDYSRLKTIRELVFGEDVTIIASIQDVSSRPTKNRRMQITEAIVSDGTSPVRLIWFNQPWILKRLHKGKLLSISGRVDQFLGRPVINNPDFEELDSEQLHTNRIVPIYPLTSQITQRWLRNTLYQTINYWVPRIKDFLPDEILDRNQLMDLPTALYQIHFPDKQENIKYARERLAFDEIFLLQLGVLRQKANWQSIIARQFLIADDYLDKLTTLLPFELTNAQKRVLSEIRSDLSSGLPMNRLLQGDVGTGKTVLAALGLAIVTNMGSQAAIMAPTSILATQHFNTITKLVDSDAAFPIKSNQIMLLIGDTPAKEKEVIRQGLEDGSILLIIGTHALIESPVTFKDLQFVVVDEQHRFGVLQRALLRSKGQSPHLLVMTATPIPRSLALTVYGDLDLSILDEMPPGRREIETYILPPSERERAYAMIRKQVALGNQAFIIYPLVEENEREEVKAAVEEHERLQQKVFPDFKLGLLHGRLKPEEKDTIMAGFRAGKYQVLVSTSVVEVGVDIPNATLMLVEGANRFGLSQLHQFRGRVGRGNQQSYCLLIPESDNAMENERLSAMTQTNDGFILAEKDLEQRGPGDFLGTRQAGFSDLKLADLTDIKLIEKARIEAQLVFKQDPELKDIKYKVLFSTFRRFWKEGQGDLS